MRPAFFQFTYRKKVPRFPSCTGTPTANRVFVDIKNHNILVFANILFV